MESNYTCFICNNFLTALKWDYGNALKCPNFHSTGKNMFFYALQKTKQMRSSMLITIFSDAWEQVFSLTESDRLCSALKTDMVLISWSNSQQENKLMHFPKRRAAAFRIISEGIFKHLLATRSHSPTLLQLFSRNVQWWNSVHYSHFILIPIM